MELFSLNTCPVCGSQSFGPFLECRDHFVSGELFSLKKCNVCGFKITAEVPVETEIGPYYQSENYISHSDTRQGLANKLYHVAREWMLGQKRKTIVRVSGKKRGTILDIGAGTGYFVAHMKKFGWQVSGTEKSGDARNVASANFGIGLFPPEKLFSLPEKEFDAVTLWHVLEHIHELQATISQIRKVLKDDGFAFIALPNHESYDACFYRENWAAYDVPRHIWHFSPEQFRQFATANGFRIVKIFRMPLDAFYVSYLSEKYKDPRLAFARGIFRGKISWLISLFRKERCSSVIYALKKA